MQTEEKALQIVKESSLSSDEANRLHEAFKPYFAQAEEWVSQARQIQITDASQIEEMTKARKARLSLKNIRIEVENRRKELKEESLRKGKAIDGMANVLKFLIEPIEEYLEKQEKFVEIQEKERLDKLESERKMILSDLGVVENSFYDLRKMPQEQFEALVKQANEAKQLREEAVKRELEEAKKKEEAEAEERRKQAEEKAKVEAEAKRLAEEARKIEEEQAKLRAEKAKLEAEQKAKAEAEAKEKARIEAEKKAEEKRLKDEEKKKAKMSDSDKVKSIVDTLKAIRFPEMKSEEAKNLVAELEMDITKMITKINNY